MTLGYICYLVAVDLGQVAFLWGGRGTWDLCSPFSAVFVRAVLSLVRANTLQNSK